MDQSATNGPVLKTGVSMIKMDAFQARMLVRLNAAARGYTGALAKIRMMDSVGIIVKNVLGLGQKVAKINGTIF